MNAEVAVFREAGQMARNTKCKVISAFEIKQKFIIPSEIHSKLIPFHSRSTRPPPTAAAVQLSIRNYISTYN